MTIKWFTRRVIINQQGYDSSGNYWGLDKPLYWCHDQEDTQDFYIRGTKDYAHAAIDFVRNLPEADRERAIHRITSTGTWH